ncbi:hypothetical protein LTR66_008511 [Elasticomyces elasticus]|nr:hypothetical protein LTR66_008511 [Elasticomyces elasticus]
MFRSYHPSHEPSTELNLRLRLVRLTTLIVRRFYRNTTTPPLRELGGLRKKNSKRAQAWYAARPDASALVPSEIPAALESIQLSADDLRRNQEHVLESLHTPLEQDTPRLDYTIEDETFYGTSSCASLLDLVPLFVALSAARAQEGSDWNITRRWMVLAAEFMLQSVLEQYLVYGNHGLEVIEQAFAWGHTLHQVTKATVDDKFGGRDPEAAIIENMFVGEHGEHEIEGWQSIRGSFILKLLPVGDDYVSHLDELALHFPIADFEDRIVSFLEALLKSMPTPILTQLEAGKLDGLTQQETDDFLQRVGL